MEWENTCHRFDNSLFFFYLKNVRIWHIFPHLEGANPGGVARAALTSLLPTCSALLPTPAIQHPLLLTGSDQRWLSDCSSACLELACFPNLDFSADFLAWIIDSSSCKFPDCVFPLALFFRHESFFVVLIFSPIKSVVLAFGSTLYPLTNKGQSERQNI